MEEVKSSEWCLKQQKLAQDEGRFEDAKDYGELFQTWVEREEKAK